MEIHELTIIGTGRLSHFFVQTLPASGFRIRQIYGRDLQKAHGLAGLCDAKAVDTLDKIEGGASLYMILLADQAIQEVAKQLRLDAELVVHAAGSLPMNILQGCSESYGVCWPLQSFTQSSFPDARDIPFCIEANTQNALQALSAFTARLSPLVYEINSDQRAFLHLAAVLVNNFTNHLYDRAEQLLEAKGLPPDILIPIIHQTASRLGQKPARLMQTGPAIRGDIEVIQKHLSLLQDFTEIRSIYLELTASIQQNHKTPPKHVEL